MDMEGLSVICAGLGITEEDPNGNRIGYSKDESCLDNLKDLLRFLRRDDPQAREVFKQVCKWNIVSKDLIPIIEYCQNDRNLVLNAVKVLVFLTMPIEPSSNDIPQQIEYLWGLKSSITNSDTVAVILSLLENPLENLEREAFTEDDWKLVQLVLTLFRNTLAIQDISLQQKAGGSAYQYLSLRDRCLELLFHESIMDIIMVVTQHIGGPSNYFRQDNLLLLEIFHYIFMGQDPELVAKALLKGSKVAEDTKTSFDSLKSIMQEEAEKRKLSRLHTISRHSQFTGTFTRLTMDGSKAVFKGNPASSSHNSLMHPQKAHRGITKRLAWDHGRLPSTQDKILELLHGFVNQFLSGGYNVLMQSIREDIEKEHPAIQNNDIIVFFQVAQFVTSFQYHKFSVSEPTVETDTSQASAENHADNTLFKGSICGPIAASMNESMFQLVISRWRNAFDGLKQTNNYKFLSAAGSLMKTMIQILHLVVKILPEDFKEPQTARILLYKLFYDQTEEGMTQFLLNLIKTFNTFKQPKSDLADLVQMIHVIVRLMESLQARGTLRVSRKSRKGKKKKALSDKKKTENELPEDHTSDQNEIDVSDNGQTTEPCRSQKESLANSDEKGTNMPSQVAEPEMSELKMGDLGESLPQMDSKKSDHANDDPYCSTDDSSGDEQPAATDEVDFKVSAFISAFASSGIIQNLCWLLKYYKSNSTTTNHYIICMLRRITDDLGLSPMLYQLSLLKIFYEILEEQKSCPCKDYENIVNFLTSLVRKMLKKMKNYPLLFVEVLFWKTRRECHCINAENLLLELGNAKRESANWGNGSVNGEIGWSHDKGWVRRSIADALGEDEADVVISYDLGHQDDEGNFSGGQEGITTCSDIHGKENSDNGGNSVEHEPISKGKRRLVLDDELVNKIKNLYEKFKDDQNCSRLIAESLEPEYKISAAQVYNKLKQQGFTVANKKRVRSAGGASSTSIDIPGEVGGAMESGGACHNSTDFESTQRQPLSRRKRVRAFSEDQEAMIKTLFEQFKDHRRCAYMIANALDPNNAFNAAQISRKLKQLGLLVPRNKRSESKMNLIDEEINDISANERQKSDDETLLSLRNRRKNKDKDLSFSGVSSEQNIDRKLSHDSDGETLSSIRKKTRKFFPKSKDEKPAATTTEGTKVDENFAQGDADAVERDGSNDSIRMDVAGTNPDAAFINNSLEDNLEAEVTGSTIKNAHDSTHRLPDDDLEDSEDDLEDSEDDLAPAAMVTSSVSRRKLRVVLDLEDDD